MALQRLESVRAALAARGHESALADSAAARVAALADNEVGLTISRIMAVLPDCRQPQPLAPERPEFTGAFGCTTAYNLGVMIADPRSEERTSELQSLMRISYAVFCLKKKKNHTHKTYAHQTINN